MMMFWLISSAMLLGGLMFLLGLRGRRVGDHPHCRKCGFDLFGLGADAKVCSECGADLGQKRAVVTGHRVKRKGLIAFGVIVLLSSLVGMGVVVTEITGRYRLTKLKPDWWLALESKSASVSTRDAAILELQLRMNSGMLSEQRVASLLEYGLDLQGDHSRPWTPTWGEFIVAAHELGITSNEQWQRFGQQAFEPQLVVRERVRQGDPLPFSIKFNNIRAGRRNIRASFLNLRTKLDGVEQSAPRSIYALVPGVGQTSPMPLRHKRFLSDLKPGAQTIEMKVNIGVTLRDINKPGPERTFEAAWTLLPADRPTIQLIDDPAMQQKVNESITVAEVKPHYFEVNVRRKPPVGLAFDIFVAAKGKEWFCGDMTVAKEIEMQTVPMFHIHTDFETEKADVILRPSINAAAKTIDIYELWNHEVIIKDVPVGRPSPTTQPQ